MELCNVSLSLPHFEHRYRLGLVNLLHKMGITDLFTDDANLNPISEQNMLSVNKIIHEAVVKVDEAGTEAAAATALVMRSIMSRRILNQNQIIMNVNQRFYYSIIYSHND